MILTYPAQTGFTTGTKRFSFIRKTQFAFLFLLTGLPALAQTFTDSNLPIITINTVNSQAIVDSPKIGASFTIYYHPNGSRNYLTDAPYYTGNIGIEIRGASSNWAMNKKSYGFETWDAQGNQIDTSLLNMPKESDWILYASHNDKTFVRNTLAYDLYNGMGHYTSRTQHCEMVLNGQYQGIYVLMEKIKRDNNRVDIAKLQPTDTAGAELTGGYIFKIDNADGDNGTQGFSTAWPFNNFFLYDYPSGDNIHPAQADYLTRYVDSAQAALAAGNFADTVHGYRHFIDFWSLVDYFLIFEVGKNPDAYGRSVYFVKQKSTDGGKLEMGPAWDFDLAWKNTSWCDGSITVDFIYQNTGTGRLDWWGYLVQDTAFQNALQCRWSYLRQNVFSDAYITNYIDSMALYLNESQQRNFAEWPVLGQNVFINITPYLTTYQAEIDSMKAYAVARLAWLDANLPGTCSSVGLPEREHTTGISTYPNPFSSELNIRLDSPGQETVSIEITDLTGRLVDVVNGVQLQTGTNTIKLQPAIPNPGMYLLTVKGAQNSFSTRILKM